MSSVEHHSEPKWQLVGDCPMSSRVPGGVKAIVLETSSDDAHCDATDAQSDGFILVGHDHADVEITDVFATPDGAEGGHETSLCVPSISQEEQPGLPKCYGWLTPACLFALISVCAGAAVYGAMVSTAWKGMSNTPEQAGFCKWGGEFAVKADNWGGAMTEFPQLAGQVRSAHVTKGAFLHCVCVTMQTGATAKLGNPFLGGYHSALLLEAWEEVEAVRGRQSDHFLPSRITVEISIGHSYRARGSCYGQSSSHYGQVTDIRQEKVGWLVEDGEGIAVFRHNGPGMVRVLIIGAAKLGSVHVAQGWSLDSISFNAWNGAMFSHSDWSSGDSSEPFVLERGDKITVARGRQHNYHLAAGIAFKFSASRLFEAHFPKYSDNVFACGEFALQASFCDEKVGLQFNGSTIS